MILYLKDSCSFSWMMMLYLPILYKKIEKYVYPSKACIIFLLNYS